MTRANNRLYSRVARIYKNFIYDSTVANLLTWKSGTMRRILKYAAVLAMVSYFISLKIGT